MQEKTRARAKLATNELFSKPEDPETKVPNAVGPTYDTYAEENTTKARRKEKAGGTPKLEEKVSH